MYEIYGQYTNYLGREYYRIRGINTHKINGREAKIKFPEELVGKEINYLDLNIKICDRII